MTDGLQVSLDDLLLSVVTLLAQRGVPGDEVEQAFYAAMHSSPYCREGF